MAMGVGCDSGLSEVETSRKLNELREKYPDVMQYFWASDPHRVPELIRESAKRNGLDAQCSFIVERNCDDCPDFLRVIPKLLYNVFGHKSILVIDMSGEVITPEEANQIALNGWMGRI